MRSAILAALLCLPALGRAQTIPMDVKDTATQEDLEYLDQRIRQFVSSFTASINAISTGTASSAAASSGTLSNPISSYTFVPETVVTQTSFIVAIVTVTASVGALPLKIKLNASAINNSIQESCWSFLIDGKHFSPLTSSIGVRCHDPAANLCFNIGGEYLIPAQTAGSHTFALMLATSNGTNLKLLARGTTCGGTSLTSDAQFGVEEFAGLVSTSGVQTNIANSFTAPITMAGSSITLNGSGGMILSGSSETASSFWGDPSHLNGIAMSSASVQKAGDTMTGQLTNTSTITVLGAAGIKTPKLDVTNGVTASSGTFTQTGAASYSLLLSSGINFSNGGQITIPSGGYIHWPDNSVSTTGASGGSGSGVQNSSFTSLPGQVITNNTLGPCITSTITFTPAANVPLDVSFSGSWTNNSTQEAGLSFLVDGAFSAPLSSSTAVLAGTPTNTVCTAATFKYRILAGLSNAAHTFCLTAATQSGTNVTITGTSTRCPFASVYATASQFGVSEVH